MAAGTAYAKRYAGGFVDGSGGGSAIDSAFLNAVETALLQLIGAAPTADGQVAQWDNANTRFGPALILNKNVDPAAGIAKSKLDFTGANGIVNADIAGAAAIDGSKLANIPISKLTTPTATSLALNISAANTDLAAPTGLTNYWVATSAGGTLRSIAAGAFAGVRITLKNGHASSFIRLLHATAGGAGAQLSIINAGHKFLAPGQSIELLYDGTNWQEVNRPAEELVCDLLLTGAQASFDTDTILGIAGSLPAVYRHLLLEVSGRCDTGATDTQAVAIRFNNDSGGNYDDEFVQGGGATASAAESLAATQGRIGNFPAATAVASAGSGIRIEVWDYASATFQKSYVALNAFKRQTTTGNVFSAQFAGHWRNTAAITRIQVLSVAGNFIAGTRFSLYGVT